MADAHKNFAAGSVAVAPAPALSGTSLTLNAGQVGLFPAFPFNAVVWPAAQIPISTNAEIVRVTNIAGNVLTIARTQESSTARAIIVGDQIAATITVKTLTDVEIPLQTLVNKIGLGVSAPVAGAVLIGSGTDSAWSTTLQIVGANMGFFAKAPVARVSGATINTATEIVTELQRLGLLGP